MLVSHVPIETLLQRLLMFSEEVYWEVLHGAPDYDTNHTGYWGSGTLFASDDEAALIHLARSLVSDVISHVHCVGA